MAKSNHFHDLIQWYSNIGEKDGKIRWWKLTRKEDKQVRNGRRSRNEGFWVVNKQADHEVRAVYGCTWIQSEGNGLEKGRRIKKTLMKFKSSSIMPKWVVKIRCRLWSESGIWKFSILEVVLSYERVKSEVWRNCPGGSAWVELTSRAGGFQGIGAWHIFPIKHHLANQAWVI